MKRILALALVLLMAVQLAGCGSRTNQDTIMETETEAKDVITLKVSCQQVEDHETTKAIRRIAEKVQTATDGGLVLELYTNSVLGDYTTIFEELMLGSIDMAIMSITGQYDTRLELLFIPYLFTDYTEAKKVFGPGSNTYSIYTEIVNGLGLEPLGIYGEGFVGVGTTKLDPNYADPTASKTTLLRVPAIESNKILVEAMNYPTVTINYSDLFSAMQSGVCDGWFGGTAELNYVAFRDVIKYYICYNGVLENAGILVNQEKYNSLPDNYRQILADACIEECLGSFDRASEIQTDNLNKLRDYGIEVIELPKDQLNKIAEHVREITWPVMENSLTSEVMDAVRKDLDE